MNSGDVAVEYIVDTIGSSAYVNVQAIVMDPNTNKYVIMGEYPVFDEPMAEMGSFIKLSNIDNRLVIDISVFSDKCINMMRSNSSLFDHLIGSKNYFHTGSKISAYEFDELVEESTALYDIDEIVNAFSDDTQLIINSLMNITPEQLPSSEVADLLLRELFGEKIVNTFSDEEGQVFNALTDEVDYTQSTEPLDYNPPTSDLNESVLGFYTNSDSVVIDGETITKQDPENPFTEDDIIKNFLGEHDTCSSYIDTIRKSLSINSARESIAFEDSLDVALTAISKIESYYISEKCANFISSVVIDFVEDEDLNSFLTEFRFNLNVDKNTLIGLLESDTTYVDCLYNGNVRQEIKVKEHLIKQFDKFFEQYNRIYKQYYVSKELNRSQTIYMFCIIFQLVHYVNKNRIKFFGEHESKVKFLEKIALEFAQAELDSVDIPKHLYLENYNTQTMEGELEIVEVAEKFMTQIRQLFNRTISMT